MFQNGVKSNKFYRGIIIKMTYLDNQKTLFSPSSLMSASPIFITHNAWVQLTNMYKSNGFMQSAVNGIVDDAFRNNALIIDSNTLKTDELETLKQALEDNGDIEAIKACLKWQQLYGGCSLIANTEQDYTQPLTENFKKLQFIVGDRWHCTPIGSSPETCEKFLYTSDPAINDTNSNIEIDKSRVFAYSGVSTPFYLKQMLNGWGMSIFESILPALNIYLEALGVSLELVSEAKIDVFKIKDLSTTLSSKGGYTAIKKRLKLVADAKNYTSTIAMDVTDDYEQKQMNFSSLPQLIEQIQLLICSALRRPYSKIFGKGGSGLSEQTSDLENYYSLVDAEVRTPATRMIKWVVDLRCIQLFGRKLPDFQPQWKPLKILTEKEEAELKSKQLNDMLALYNAGIMTKKQIAQKLTEKDILLFSDEELAKLPDEVEETADSPDELLKTRRN